MIPRSSGTPWQLWSSRRIYAPLVPRMLWLMVRYRICPWSVFRVNPKLPFAGTGLDSKFDSYQLFADCEFAIPTTKVACAADLTRDAIEEILTTSQIDYPVIGKPDCGLLSVGVRLFTNTPDLLDFLRGQPVD